MSMKRSQCVGLGGTFDHFHKGHQEFLRFASQYGERLVIGVTHQSMTTHKEFAQLIEPFSTRSRNVKSFCENNNIPVEIAQLTDIYGPTVSDPRIDALVVTEETVAGGSLINLKRQQIQLQPLPTFVFSLILDEEGNVITSTAIRRGNIDRSGKSYIRLLREGVELSSSGRIFFNQPQGPLISSLDKTAKVLRYVVGDVCLETFLAHGWQYHAAWFDRLTKRKPYISSSTSLPAITHRVTNHSGNISSELVNNLYELIASQNNFWKNGTFPDKTAHVLVSGEEDLATVGLVLLAPLGTNIFYGQPNSGIVEIDVTEQLKDKFLQACA